MKWPKEYTREVLTYLAEKIDVQIDAEHYQPGQSRALAALAAIAPERKKRMVKRWVWADSEGRVCWSADSISHAAGAILVEVPVVED